MNHLSLIKTLYAYSPVVRAAYLHAPHLPAPSTLPFQSALETAEAELLGSLLASDFMILENELKFANLPNLFLLLDFFIIEDPLLKQRLHAYIESGLS